jgi:hypothetical protein
MSFVVTRRGDVWVEGKIRLFLVAFGGIWRRKTGGSLMIEGVEAARMFDGNLQESFRSEQQNSSGN